MIGVNGNRGIFLFVLCATYGTEAVKDSIVLVPIAIVVKCVYNQCGVLLTKKSYIYETYVIFEGFCSIGKMKKRTSISKQLINWLILEWRHSDIKETFELVYNRENANCNWPSQLPRIYHFMSLIYLLNIFIT